MCTRVEKFLTWLILYVFATKVYQCVTWFVLDFLRVDPETVHNFAMRALQSLDNYFTRSPKPDKSVTDVPANTDLQSDGHEIASADSTLGK